MQTQSSARKRSPISILSHILRTEGLRSAYKGVAAPLLSLSIVNTLSFTSYSYFRSQHFHGNDGWDYKNALSGLAGAPVFGIVTTPENFLKTQMQLDNTRQLKGRFTSSFHCAKTLVSSHGLSVLYTGGGINTIREAAFVGTYFFCYEGYKTEFQQLLMRIEKYINPNTSNNNHGSSWSTTFAIPISGGFAGASAWALTFPLDCIRAGVQGQQIPTSSNEPIQKRGALEVLRQLKTKGFTRLYSGVSPTIARAFIVSGTRFSAYEGALFLCRKSGLTLNNRQSISDEGPGAYDD